MRTALKAHRLPKIARGIRQFGIPGIFSAEFNPNKRVAAAIDVLKRGKSNLLLILDEVQHLGQSAAPLGEYAGIAAVVLDSIHDGKLGRPVILLAGGLSTSRRALKTLGVPRFSAKCTVLLGPLSPGETRRVLHDWLTKDGQAKGAPSAWIEAVSKETHGWPQHILVYVDAALKQLHEDHRLMTSPGLRAVLLQGRTNREAYYAGRTEDFTPVQLQRLAQALAASSTAHEMSHETHMTTLANLHDYKRAAEQLFFDTLHTGVLARSGRGYEVPIPSLKSW